MIPYEDLKKVNLPYAEELKAAFASTLNSGWFILGKEVTHFEANFANYIKAAHCIGVSNGLEAMVLALKALELPLGSEIIVPSNTYIATILAVIQAGHIPVLVEPDICTYNINPDNILAAITPKTKVILVVHLYGKCCNMSAIVPIAETNNLLIIEDCAQAHGALQNGLHAGTFGTMGCWSYYPTKNLGALGDAGAITTDDTTLDTKLRRLRNYGSDKKYHNEVLGHNARLDEVQAAFLNVKLSHLDQINNHKRLLAQLYLEGLKDSQFILPVVEDGYHDVYHIFTIRHKDRDKLRQYLLDKGIQTEIHYPVPPTQQTALKGIVDGSFPIAEEIHSTTLSLPCSTAHTAEEIYKVIMALLRF